MASTASPLRTVPSDNARCAPAPLPVPAAYARTDLRRGNHPAGRALSRSTAQAAERPIAPVLPLRPAGGGVVPLRRGTSRGTPVPVRPALREVPVEVVAVEAPPVEAPPAGTVAVGASGQAARLRLTRRGRVVLSGLGVVAALGMAVVVGPALGGAAHPALELAGQSSVVVHSGDTLWSIAESVAPDADPRGVVDALREVNGLHDTRLEPGQVLLLP